MSCRRKELVYLCSWFEVQRSCEDAGKICYCLLNHGTLTISNNEFQTIIEASIPLDQIKEIHQVSHGSFFGLVIQVEGEEFQFITKDKFLIERWIFALQKKPEALPSPRISEFTILKKIGSGFSGEVLLAVHNRTHTLVALKSISKADAMKSKSSMRAIAERNILMQSSHPFITRLLSAFQSTKRLFLALEFIQGGDLSFHLYKGATFSERQIKLYLAEIAVALSHLHKLGIVFRDLKPSNILVSADGHLKLTDFGLARFLIDKNRQSNSMCGTKEYLSPEMINGKSYSFTVDWWAFGVLAYQLIIGQLPFSSVNITRLYKAITTQTPRYLNKCSDVEKSFLEGLLTKDPTMRLGCREDGENEIFSHPYFSGLNWDDVYDKKYTPEFLPLIEDTDLLYNFDADITNQPLPDIGSDQDLSTYIKGFSFTATEDLFEDESTSESNSDASDPEHNNNI